MLPCPATPSSTPASVVNAGVEWQLSATLTAFAQVDNLFDEDYATFGLYGAAEEVLGDEFDDPRFVSPAAPLSAWIGVRWML
jgi:iron complex outermembrane recepter protein